MNIFRLYREGFTLEGRNAGVVKPAQILVPVLSLLVTVQAGLAQVPVLTIDPITQVYSTYAIITGIFTTLFTLAG
jgi:hypothetical protein